MGEKVDVFSRTVSDSRTEDSPKIWRLQADYCNSSTIWHYDYGINTNSNLDYVTNWLTRR